MTDQTHELVLGALDSALTQHVCKLFNVLMSDPDEDGIERFLAGLNLAIGVHEQLAVMFAPEP